MEQRKIVAAIMASTFALGNKKPEEPITIDYLIECYKTCLEELKARAPTDPALQ